MVLKYHISPSAITENFIVKIWEAGSDGAGAEVYTSAPITAPHALPFTLTVNGLDKVVHIVRMYTQISAALLHEFNAEPKTDIVSIYDPIRFKIGDGQPLTPAIGTQTYTNPLLIGLTANDYIIMRNRVGTIFPGTDEGQYVVDSIFGSFVLNASDVFGDAEEFTLQIAPNVITSVVNDSVVAKWFAGFVDINANRNYLNSDLRKLIRLLGSNQYTFPVGQVVPIGYGFCFQHFGSLGVGRINFLNYPLIWGTATKSFIDLPDYSEACFSFDGTNWNVVYLSQSDWINGSSIPTGATIAVGSMHIGDVPAGDQTYTIVHNKNIVGDYFVFLSIRGTAATIVTDNNVTEMAWYHHATDKPNKFNVCIREDAPSLQNIDLCWLLIKA